MSDRYFADLDIHGEVIRFYPDDGKARLHQNDARRIPVESVTFVRENAIADAVAAERERCIDIVANAAPGNDCTLPAHDEAILTVLAEDIVEAIRSATK